MLGKDFSYASRTLRKNPVFTITAVITIALGVGAITAIFSAAHGVLLNPLPYKDPDRLVLAVMDLQKRNALDLPLSNADYFDLHDGSKSAFEDFAAVSTFQQVVQRDDGTPERLRFAAVTTNFFDLMGGQIVAGRNFNADDGQPQPQPPPVQPGAAPAPPAVPPLPVNAIISYRYWHTRYGGSPSALGRRLPNLQGGGPIIVGVLAPGFELLLPPKLNEETHPDVWIAARISYDAANRKSFGLRPIGRLKPGVTLARAQNIADSISAHTREIDSLSNTAGYHARLEPLQRYVVAEVRPAVVSLTGASLFLLLIACANVANLLLVRASLREREFAVRSALGGSWWRLVRQVLVESLLLSACGTALGIGLAWLGIRELVSIAPENLPRLNAITIDWQVLAFAAATGVGASILFGLMPAVRAANPDAAILLHGGRSVGFGWSKTLRSAVVVAEVALSFGLLIGSGLMMRSFIALQHIDPGFDAHHLLTALIIGGRPAKTPEARQAKIQDIESRLKAIPGVETVTASVPLPLTGGFSPIRWGLESALADNTKYQATDFQIVLPGYFEAMGTKLLAGRTFTEADNSPKQNVVIVDDFLAQKAFGKESAVGKRILIRIRTPEAEWVQIIGVVQHQRVTSLALAGREQIYFTDGFLGHDAVARWAIRTHGDPARYESQVRAQIANADPQLLVGDVQSMDTVVVKAQSATRFSLLLLGVLASIAALLAAVGLYGVLSTLVRQRTSEIGVRMALGAAPKNIFKLIVNHGLRLTLAGIVAGFAAAFVLTRVMTSMLVEVKPTDPITFVSVAALFFAIAAIACWLPARRAAGLDPTVALREQ